MRYGLLVLIGFFAFSVCAEYKPSYQVVGTDQTDSPVHGQVYTNDDPWEVTGQITDKHGDTHEFYGRWNGKGKITGEMDDGNDVELTAK